MNGKKGRDIRQTTKKLFSFDEVMKVECTKKFKTLKAQRENYRTSYKCFEMS
jgi:hypothetical protein